MTVVPKATLRRNLDHLKLLDTQNGSPFVGVHLGDPGVIHVRRTSSVGFIESEGAPHVDDQGWVYISLPHAVDCLRYIESEAVDVLKLNKGSVMFRSTGVFESELRVHTVSRENAGCKIHNPGAPFKDLEIACFRGLNVKPFTLASPPVILGSHVMMVTPGGTVAWGLDLDPEMPSNPREAFLRVIADAKDGMMTLTERGYFATCFEGMVFVIAGHQTPLPVAIPATDGAKKMTTVPPARLTQALRNAAGLAATGAPITITPRGGILTRNSYQQPVRFGLGDLSPFMPFDVYSGTAKMIAEALDQAQGDEVTLYRLPSGVDRVLFVRGNCVVLVQALTPAVIV